MKHILILMMSLIIPGWVGCAAADPWKHDGSKGRWRDGYERDWHDRDRKVKFRTADGCKVERKWKHGVFEEKVKCKRW